MSRFTVKNASDDFVRQFVGPGLLAAAPYQIDRTKATLKLDQNESPWDWPPALKDRIVRAVRDAEWNRYPSPMAEEMHEKLARYVGVPPACLVTGPGSNFLIALLLEAFGARAPGKRVIARPSFALFESHAKAIGMPYEPWPLTPDFQYDVARLPALTPHGVLLFASPNNPTGNVLPYATLEALLDAHPETLFIADEAYYEFSDKPYTPLLARHANLILIRTFSKTVGAAGVRLGYVVGPEGLMAQLAKIRLPYLLNHFTLEAIGAILDDPGMGDYIARNVTNAKAERERVHTALAAEAPKRGFQVFPSEANFLLMRWPDEAARQRAYGHLLAQGILIRDVSRGPGLAGCMRVTIGNHEQNDVFLAAMRGL